MSFSDEVNDFILNVPKANDKITRSTVIQLWSAIIKGSPVKTGRFRANWFASDKTPSSESNLRLTSERGAITRATASVKSQIKGDVFTLTNNLPYSEVIEFGGYPDGPNTTGGFSKQAPSGVLRVTVKRFNTLIKANAKKFGL